MNKGVITHGFINQVKTFALKVFDQRQAGRRKIVRQKDSSQDGFPTQMLMSGAISFPPRSFRMSFRLPDRNRLQESFRLNARSQFPDRLGINHLARLVRVGNKIAEQDLDQGFALFFRFGNSRGGRTVICLPNNEGRIDFFNRSGRSSQSSRRMAFPHHLRSSCPGLFPVLTKVWT